MLLIVSATTIQQAADEARGAASAQCSNNENNSAITNMIMGACTSAHLPQGLKSIYGSFYAIFTLKPQENWNASYFIIENFQWSALGPLHLIFFKV